MSTLRERLRAAKDARAGQRWADVRKEAGLSERGLERLLSDADPERGKRGPGLDTVERLARAVGVRPGWLAFGEGEP